jgi:hypothetical protein
VPGRVEANQIKRKDKQGSLRVLRHGGFAGQTARLFAGLFAIKRASAQTDDKRAATQRVSTSARVRDKSLSNVTAGCCVVEYRSVRTKDAGSAELLLTERGLGSLGLA